MGNVIAELAEGGAKGLFEGIGKMAKDLRTAITGVDPVRRAELEAKLAELEYAALNAQAQINMEEAKSESLFVSGWRPYIGWVCGIALTVQYVVLPLLYAFDIADAIALDFSELVTLLVGMLGFGYYRTKEKMGK